MIVDRREPSSKPEKAMESLYMDAKDFILSYGAIIFNISLVFSITPIGVCGVDFRMVRKTLFRHERRPVNLSN